MITEQSLVGIEIKSDADTYVRLATQVKDYDKYYDCNFAVVGSSGRKLTICSIYDKGIKLYLPICVR